MDEGAGAEVVQQWWSRGGPEVVQMYHIADQVQVQRYRGTEGIDV
jgi:flavoprotein